MILNPVRRPVWARYVVAVLAVALAAAVRAEFLGSLGTRVPYVTFYPAVLVAALAGGLPGGLLATALSVLTATFAWVEPVGQFSIRDFADWLAAGIFVMNCAMISWVIHAMQRAQTRASEAETRVALAMERSRAEEALRECEERYRALFDRSLDWVYLCDFEGHFLDANQAALEGLGYRREDIAALTFQSLLTEDQLPLALQTGEEVLATGHQRSPAEFLLRRKDGGHVLVESQASLIYHEGKPHAILGIARDITDRKRTEEKLRQSEERLRLILDAANTVAFDLNPVDGILYEAGPVDRLFGRARGFAHPGVRDLAASIHPADRERVLGAMESTLRGGGEYRVEYRVPLEDGDEKWISANGSSPRDADGKPARLLGVAIDVTARKRAELRLSESEAELKAAQRIAQLGSWQWDLRTDTATWSDEMFRIFGLAPFQLEAHRKGFLAKLHPADRARVDQALTDALDGTAEYDIEYRVQRPDGSERTIHAHGEVLRDEAGGPTLVRGTVHDITERRLAEQEREKLTSQLIQSQKLESIGRLAGGVAHDFNNLLTVINGYSQLLLAKLSAGDPVRTKVEEIHKAGERAAGLTRQLLAFSRKQVLQPRRLDLNRVVREIRPMLERLVGEAVEVRVVLTAESGAVHADPHQLEQVIMNLAVNARDAMPSGGSLLIETAGPERDQSYARSHPDAHAGYVMLAVSDSGVGMDEETRQRIFEPFFTTKGVGQGTGLGLSMVQGIVAQSGGYIDVVSQPGQGTTFKIYLPALPQAAAEAETPAAVPALGGKETVLVVEDQAEVRNFVIAVLKTYGYCVIPAENAGEALLLCERKERIDLLLTDVVMPNLSGRELADRLAKLRPGIKVLFMSGYTDDIVVHHGVSEEGAEFIQKPFSPAELAGKVRAVLGPAPS